MCAKNGVEMRENEKNVEQVDVLILNAILMGSIGKK